MNTVLQWYEASNHSRLLSQTCLGDDTSRCLLARLNGVTILLDCGASAQLTVHPNQNDAELAPQTHQQSSQPSLDLTNERAQHAQISLKIPDLDSLSGFHLDAILISSPSSFLALPLHHQQRRLPLHVYATEACYNMAKHWAHELICAQQRLDQQCAAAGHIDKHNEQQELPQLQGQDNRMPLQEQQHTTLASATEDSHAQLASQTTRQQHLDQITQHSESSVGQTVSLFTEAQLLSCLEAVQVVRYGQRVTLPGGQLTAGALPSGSGMGCAVWKMTEGSQKYVNHVSHVAMTQAVCAATLHQMYGMVAPAQNRQCLEPDNQSLGGQSVAQQSLVAVAAGNHTGRDRHGCNNMTLQPPLPCRVAFLSEVSLYAAHAEPLMTTGLYGLDALVLLPGCVTHHKSALLNPRKALPWLANAAVKAVAAGGHVLVPVNPTGEVVQLLHDLGRVRRAARMCGDSCVVRLCYHVHYVACTLQFVCALHSHLKAASPKHTHASTTHWLYLLPKCSCSKCNLHA